jgi:nucleoside 2-deoxyribosyltransferase
LTIYLIGSLRNPEIPLIGNRLREAGIDAFDEWHDAGPEADDYWKKDQQTRGRTYIEALESYAADHVFEFDYFHLNRCNGAILVLPAGRSAHLELGYMIGQGKPGYVLLDKDTDRWDVMYRFATGVFFDLEELVKELKLEKNNILRC